MYKEGDIQMLFPNAHNGVKKIYTAEILSLIVAILLAAAAIAGLFAASLAESGKAEAEVATAGGFLLLVLAGGILALIAFILNLVGIISAMKDEPTFKNALIFTIIGIAASVLSSSFSKNETVSSFIQILVNFSELFVSLFVVQGIMALAARMNNNDMVERGNKVRWWLVITFAIPSLIKLVSAVLVLKNMETVAGVLSLIAAVLTLIAYFIYLSYLAKAKKMLAA